ncbi:MAG TPA: hypothetical protein PK782_17350, partial [Nitrospira sp.]|nr:hypothetical protein [Nitrospira sp.]
RGTAYGCFNLASGLAMLMASIVAGFLWDRLGAAFTFYAGALFSSIAVIGIVVSPGTAPAPSAGHSLPPRSGE